MALESLVRPIGLGAVFVAPSEWVLDPDTLVQPVGVEHERRRKVHWNERR